MNFNEFKKYCNKHIHFEISRPFYVKWIEDNKKELNCSNADLFYFLVLYYLEHEDYEYFLLLHKED